MKRFDIQIIDAKPKKIHKIPTILGQINIGDFKEKFYMPLSLWNIAQYLQQWQEGLNRLKNYGSSCLVTSIENGGNGLRIEWWLLYKINNTVYIQNHLLGNEVLKERSIGLPCFDLASCYLYIPLRETKSDDGEEISEWEINIHDLFDN